MRADGAVRLGEGAIGVLAVQGEGLQEIGLQP